MRSKLGYALAIMMSSLLAGLSVADTSPDQHESTDRHGSTDRHDSTDKHERVHFNRDIRPLISDRCLKCHGPDGASRRKNLRLDQRESATALRRGHEAVIVPGDPERSLLLQRLRDPDTDSRMPPPESHLSMSEDEIELIERWISEGAEYEPHWALVPPPESTSPGASSGRDSIDEFIRDRLTAEGLEPAPEADPRTWLRRASYVITGLPPSPKQLESFAMAPTESAYEQQVDRLLASPQYGERMASDWLDLARYADTYGYQNDVYRDVWPWRDWIIQAFNDNLSYDQFLTWQLAGDLLPDATHEQRLATTFNRLHRQTNEGGSVDEEFRVEYVSDRLHTMGTAFLGLTFECARCHDHKYDPISQREYYEMTAFFNSIDESGLYSHFTSATPTPALALPSDGQRQREQELRTKLATAEAKLAALREEARLQLDDRTPAKDWTIHGEVGRFDFETIDNNTVTNVANAALPATLVESPEVILTERGTSVRLSGDNSVHFPKLAAFTRHQPFSLSLWLKTPDFKERAVVLRRSRAWTDAGSQGYQLLIQDGKLEWSLIHFWPGDAISVRCREALSVDQWHHVTVSSDGSSRAAGLRITVDGRLAETDMIRDHLTRGITGGGPGALAIGQRFRDRGFAGGIVDDVRIFDRELTALEKALVFDASSATFSKSERFDYYLHHVDTKYAQQLKLVEHARQGLAQHQADVPQIMTMKEMDPPRATFVLDRGSYDRRTDRVERNTPAALPPLRKEHARNRLGLARWLTDPEHPLTARVAVNRLWQTVFGRGLVETSDNFGSQGAPPSHPELLDTLAREFVASGWDQKAMLERLLLSATFRQSSVHPPSQRQDPENRLWSRGPARRLTAEMLRDSMLHTSGLLVPKIGGRSVRPYQPEGLWREKGNATYSQDRGEGLYRRSLYTIWKRTSPPPSMMIFDAAKRDVCIAQRQQTNTPLQALVLLNDPQCVEAARVLAERTLSGKALSGKALSDSSDSTTARITELFQMLCARDPRPQELAALEDLQRSQLQHYRTHPELAQQLLEVGEHTHSPKLEDATLAAWTVLTSTLFSYDGFVMLR